LFRFRAHAQRKCFVAQAASADSLRQTQNLVVELETPIETKMDSIASVDVLPTIRVEHWVDAILEPQSLTMELSTTHKIENAGVFQLEFDIPADFELLQVAGRSGPSLEAASILVVGGFVQTMGAKGIL